MFKLGGYPEEEARDLKSRLEKLGIRTEQRASLETIVDDEFYKEGRLSELKDEIEGIEEYQGYLDAMKRVLTAGANQDTFIDLFYSELDPKIHIKRKILAKALDDALGGESDLQDGSSQESSSQADILQEVNDLSGEEVVSMMADLSKAADALEFATDVLCRNEIEIGKDVGTKLDDPIISIQVEPEDYEDCEDLIAKTSVEIVKVVDIYVDELSTAMAEELDDEFTERYPEEAIDLGIIGAFISYLAEPSDTDKVDMDEFRELCRLDLDTDHGKLSIDGWAVAEDLAKALEKGGVLKVKGDKIKWRKMGRA